LAAPRSRFDERVGEIRRDCDEMMLLNIDIPRNFNFKRTVSSHGWCSLAPFTFDPKRWELKYVFQTSARIPIAVAITCSGRKLRARSDSTKLSKKGEREIATQIKHIFRFDEELDGFYAVVRNDERFAWISKVGAGRLLRSPTVFEDLVKTICTTNCSWALTDKMVSNLVSKLGDVSATGVSAFPSADAMAEKSEKFYREEIRAGYRAPYFVELARRITKGNLDPQNWLDSELPTRDLKKEIKSVKGVGDYAAENLMKLLGRYEGLALDSWLRSEFSKIHNKGKRASDSKIERFYREFGEWKGLAMWCDMTKSWLQKSAPEIERAL